MKRSNLGKERASDRVKATHFMQYILNKEPSRVVELDERKDRKDRKRPDYAFYYSSGQRYNLELKRWVTPELRQLQAQLNKSVAQPLENKLNGKFALYVLFEKFPEGRIHPDKAQDLVSKIEQIIDTSPGVSQDCIVGDCVFSKVGDDGHRLVPVITAPELPIYLDDNSQEAETVKDLLSDFLYATEKKFRYYRGLRIFLLDMSQNILDIEFHAGISSDGPGIICKWCSELLVSAAGIDYVYVNQFRIWGSGGTGTMRRILTGHKYVDRPAPYYKQVWRKPGLPRHVSLL